ncbi:MAG: oligopeptide/dipeptide ABC transporter ATP-binding protein [Planctomycetota bacterium]
MAKTNMNLLTVENLKTHFPIRRGLLRQIVGYVKAVDGISFAIAPGKTLGLVGESGCGKTTAARTIIRLIPATSGNIEFEGRDVLAMPAGKLQSIRSRMSIIFQDPYGSLNPRMTVTNIVGEALKVHKKVVGSELAEQVAELLIKVGLSPDHMNRYPHEFSGGQRQRIGIARALVLRPKLVICDEPVSALDVSIQSQILNLLKDLQDEFDLTYLFIAHDLAVVEHISDAVAVMYLGRIVEQAPAQALYDNPLHPYTQALIRAIPCVKTVPQKKSRSVAGEIPSPADPPPGCPFHTRCPLAENRCKLEIQTLQTKDKQYDHFVACWKA